MHPPRFLLRTGVCLLLVWLGLGLDHLVALEPKGVVLEAGIYQLPQRARPETKERLRGRRLQNRPALLVSTNRIPCEKGMVFGIKYAVTNLALANGETLKLQCKILHPPIVFAHGDLRFDTTKMNTQVENGGAEGVFMVGLSDETMLLPGYWEIVVSLRDQPLVRHGFQLVKPESPPAAPAPKEAEKKSAPPP